MQTAALWLAYGLVGTGGGLLGLSALELMVRHPAPGKRASWYAARGALFFNSANFASTGKAAHRRMLAGMGLLVMGFFATGVVLLGG